MVSLAAIPAAAQAARPIFFYKSGVTRTAFETDVTTCRDLVAPVKTPAQPYVYQPNLYAVAAASFLSGLLGSKERRHIVENVLRTCMADKGYRRVMDETLERDVSKLKDMPRFDRLYALASAEQPVGKILPR